MNTLKNTLVNEMNFNFNTVENTIKTIGTIIIVAASVALVVNSFINPSEFVL